MKNMDSCEILANAIIQAYRTGATIIRVKNIGIPLTSFDRYLRNPLFDYVKGSDTFTIKWTDGKIGTIYNPSFARVINFNHTICQYPEILNCALKMWTSPFTEGYSPGRTNPREQVMVKMKKEISELWNLYVAYLPVENPMFHFIVKPVIIEEATRRLSGNSLLVQYDIRPTNIYG